MLNLHFLCPQHIDLSLQRLWGACCVYYITLTASIPLIQTLRTCKFLKIPWQVCGGGGVSINGIIALFNLISYD